MNDPGARRARAVDAALIVGLHATLCVAARAAGFDHVSDDDFARLTIAQGFAHAPRLDPSGTSWLPFPFWVLGLALTGLGRSLAAARGASIALASVAAALPYLVLARLGVERRRALLAVAFAFATPWAIWLGATTVPESFTASLAAAGAIGIGAAPAGAGRVACALAILAACLSRYEPWPVAAVLAIVSGARAWRSRGAERTSSILTAAICAIGPLAWMAWNAHAHDGPLHFFRRVSTYKRAIGAGATDAIAALLFYPALLFRTRPEVALAAVLLLPSLGDRAIRRRWAVPLASAAAQLAFLACGNVRDGAPAHHPERALLGTLVLLALFVGDVGPIALAGTRRAVAGACVGVLWLASIVRDLAEPPGQTPAEDRAAAIASGEALRKSGAARVVVTPCAYEHFALIAAYGAPENVAIEPRADPPPGAPCPRARAP